MPRADKNVKIKKSARPILNKTEKKILEGISCAPKFPEKLVGLKKHRKNAS